MIAIKHLTFSIDAIAPTDSLLGHIKYWGCLSCNHFFADSDGFYEIYEPPIIPPISQMSVLYLPADLKIIEKEAFSNLDCEAIIIPEGCTIIGEKAFGDCKNLLYVKLPASAT